jgi:hypothetical protein
LFFFLLCNPFNTLTNQQTSDWRSVIHRWSLFVET